MLTACLCEYCIFSCYCWSTLSWIQVQTPCVLKFPVSVFQLKLFHKVILSWTRLLVKSTKDTILMSFNWTSQKRSIKFHASGYFWSNRITSLTPSLPAVPNCCCSNGSPPYWSNRPFLIFDIRVLWRSVLSARAPVCQKLKMMR